MKIDGLILESRYAEYQFCCKGPVQTNWQDGFPRQEPKHIVLPFDDFVCILDDAARNGEWTEEDKEYIGHALDRYLNDPHFTEMWLHEKPRPPLPWPKYNETHHKQIPSIALATGTVNEAIRFEQGRENPRVEVLAKLNDLLNEVPVDSVEVENEDLAAV